MKFSNFQFAISQFVILTMFFFMACGSVQEQGATTEEAKESLTALEKVKLTDLQGNPISLESYEDKTLVLNFWATWCKPCIQEMPSMEKAQQALEGHDFVFLLASDEDIDKINRFVEKQQMDLPFAQLKTGVQNLDIYSLPTTWIVREGEIIREIVGSREWDSEEFLKELQTL